MITDPQGNTIEGAKVSQQCGHKRDEVMSDTRGMAIVELPRNYKKCVILVTAPGFALYHGPVKPPSDPWIIQLELRGPDQYVAVQAEEKAPASLIEQTNLGSVSLSAEQLSRISNNTEDLIRFAKGLAGTTLDEDVIYVDGMPSSVLPPAAAISQITINTDPFSAEYSENDINHIEIATKMPDRHFRWNAGAGSFGFGGGNSFQPGLHSVSHSLNVGLMSPIPKLPLAFSLYGSFGYAHNDQPIMALSLPGQTNPTTARSASFSDSVLFTTYYSRSSFTTNMGIFESAANNTNSGVGGIVLPQAGSTTHSTASEVRGGLRKEFPNLNYDVGFVITGSDLGTQANSNAPGIRVLGDLITGGASIVSSQTSNLNWMSRQSIKTMWMGHPLTTGITISGASNSEMEIPNPGGVLQFETLHAYSEALVGTGTGTLFALRGDGHLHYRNLSGAIFLEQELLHSKTTLLRWGIRADWQERAGVFLSPRVFSGKQLAHFVFRGGGGLFIHNWPNSIFIHSLGEDQNHLHQVVIPDVSFDTLQSSSFNNEPNIVSELASNLSRERDIMFKCSVERPFGKFTSGVEYTWTNRSNLLGSSRLPSGTGWLDVLQSDRQARKHQVHVRLQFPFGKGQMVGGHYEWTRSRDDTSGAFSFPERGGDLENEWGDTAGVSPHNFYLTGNFQVQRDFSLSVSAGYHSEAPYNITSSINIAGDYLYNDRGGRPRNSGNEPGFGSLSLSGYRRIPLPHFLAQSKNKVYASIGISANNLLNNASYTTFGSVAGSNLFGKPVGASATRSIKIWLNFDN